MQKIKPINHNKINESSLGQLIEEIEQESQKEFEEEELMRQLSASQILQPDANKEQIDELEQMNRSISAFGS